MYEYIKQEKKNKYQASNRIYMLPCKTLQINVTMKEIDVRIHPTIERNK